MLLIAFTSVGKFIVTPFGFSIFAIFLRKIWKLDTIYRKGFLPIINSYPFKLAFKIPFCISFEVKSFSSNNFSNLVNHYYSEHYLDPSRQVLQQRFLHGYREIKSGRSSTDIFWSKVLSNLAIFSSMFRFLAWRTYWLNFNTFNFIQISSKIYKKWVVLMSCIIALNPSTNKSFFLHKSVFHGFKLILMTLSRLSCSNNRFRLFHQKGLCRKNSR